jgi:enoyl-CoA hydratase/carnithine racemase
MANYTLDQLANALTETYAFLEVQQSGQVLTIRLNRAEKKNALHPHMVNELAFAMSYAKHEKSVWAVVLEARGDVFCAGADLKAFMGGDTNFTSTIPKPNGEVLIGELFNKVYKPVIAKVGGDVFAGGFLFLAGSTYVVAAEGLRFGLPEVKRGLFPYQVMAALLNVMPARTVIDWCIRGYDLPVERAMELGLVTHCVKREALDSTVQGLLDELLVNSPTAIRMGLEAFDHIRPKEAEHAYLLQMLQKTVGTKDGMEGLTAFREKRAPKWTGE